MDSDDSLVALQCDAVAQALQQLRDTFRSRNSPDIVELLDQFWAVQDHLHRLLAALSDDPAKLHNLDQRYPSLSSEVTEILSSASSTPVGSLGAVTYSCRAIHDSLFKIQNLKHSSAMAASA